MCCCCCCNCSGATLAGIGKNKYYILPYFLDTIESNIKELASSHVVPLR